jgi:predicted nucleotidyltransferase
MALLSMNESVLKDLPREKIAEFCRDNHISKLSFFGSVLSGDFRPGSDVDVLVEFAEGHVPGFFDLARMEMELSEVLARKVDLRTPGELSRYFRDEVVSSARVEYVKG